MSFGLGFGFPRLGGAKIRPAVAFDFTSGSQTLDPRITFSRTTNATLIGSNGSLQYAPHNLLTYSEQFDNAVWVKARTSISANTTTAPDGTVTADKLVEDATNNTHICYFSSFTFTAQVYTASFYLKAAERTKAEIVAGSASTAVGLGFDLTAGTTFACTVSGTVAPTSSSIVNVGAGWWRCSITWTAIATVGIDPRVYVNDGTTTTYTGDGTSGIYVWGAQLNVGALQPYYSTTVKNTLGFTQEFDNAAWNKNGSTITANTVSAPDGSLTADKLIPDISTGPHYVTPSPALSLVVGQVLTYSVYAKAAELTFLQLILTGIGPGAANLTAGFDLTTGIAGTPSAGSTSSIVAVGNGWYRCGITTPIATAGTPTQQIRPAQNSSSTPSSYTGDGTSGIYIWGAQFSDSASLDLYKYNPGAAPTASAYYGPRFNYEPVTLAPLGLLIEEARTNHQTYSEDLTQWGTPVNASVSANVAVAPDGFTTADKLVEDAALASHFLSATLITYSYTSGTSYTRSCFLKAAGRSIVTVYLPGAAFPSNERQALFNLSTGTVFSVEPNVVAKIQNVGNGWYRCSVTAIASVTVSAHVGGSALTDNGNGTYTGDGVSGAFVWGAQMEVATFATSYIPTTTTVLTRAADIPSMTGANFSNWYNPLEGTTVVEASTMSALAAGMLTHAISDNTFNNSIYGNFSSGNTYRGANVIVGGVAQTGDIGSFTGLTTSNPNKDAFAYKLNSFAESCNGATTRTDLLGTVPVVDRLYLGTNWSGNGNFLNGHISSFAYYPARLSNDQLQNITTFTGGAWLLDSPELSGQLLTSGLM